eukprot:jgi/Mesvir1/14378/Mv09776-RA.1
MASTRPDGGGHALSFRVMRLCRPSFHIDSNSSLRFNAQADIHRGEDDMPEVSGVWPNRGSVQPGEHSQTFSHRFELANSTEAAGLTGSLVLPQDFGTIYLGESLGVYISVGNFSDRTVSSVAIKVELQTDRHKVVLGETGSNPIPSLIPGSRHELVVRQDINDIGAHTLVCSAIYIDGADNERKFLPQYYKFEAVNPLGVRTKELIFLEACIENLTKVPLFVDYVRLDPARSLQQTQIYEDEALRAATAMAGDLGDSLRLARDDGGAAALDKEVDALLDRAVERANLIPPNGGARNYLFRLTRIDTAGASAAGAPPVSTPRASKGTAGDSSHGGSVAAGSTSTLGKIDIAWRSTLGETGRLQTQQILGAPAPSVHHDVQLSLVSLPRAIALEKPFRAKFCVRNCTDRLVGPLQVQLSPGDMAGGFTGVVVKGKHTLVLGELKPQSEQTFEMCFIALSAGVQRIVGLAVHDQREGRALDLLQPVEFFVSRD